MLSPTGVPRPATALAAIVVVVAQIVSGRRELWLRKLLAERGVSAERLKFGLLPSPT